MIQWYNIKYILIISCNDTIRYMIHDTWYMSWHVTLRTISCMLHAYHCQTEPSSAFESLSTDGGNSATVVFSTQAEVCLFRVQRALCKFTDRSRLCLCMISAPMSTIQIQSQSWSSAVQLFHPLTTADHWSEAMAAAQAAILSKHNRATGQWTVRNLTDHAGQSRPNTVIMSVMLCQCYVIRSYIMILIWLHDS